MNADELRAIQAPWKTLYREQPARALHTLTATGRVGGDGPSCRVETPPGTIDAGLHPAAGGDGGQACPGEMLLQALAGCAGVTLTAVATALGIPIRGGVIEAEGDLDFRGTLGVDRAAPVGFTAIRLRIRLDSDADDTHLAKLVELTERYCVVYQTLHRPGSLSTSLERP